MVKSKRTKLLFRILNKHQFKLSNLDMSSARSYFDKINSTFNIPKIHKIYETSVGKNKIKLRIYKPVANNIPTIVYFHGGGFVVGSLNSHDKVARLLCKNALCNVVSVSYRLAPENPFPKAIEDGVEVLRWLQSQHEISNTEVYLAGDSAGGHIALFTYLAVSRDINTTINGLILMYPALDPSLSSDSIKKYAKKHFITRDNMEVFWNAYLAKQKLEWPLKQKTIKNLPPVLIQTAEHDLLRDEGLDFAELIDKSGGNAEYHCYSETTHGFMQIPSIISRRNKALKDITQFIYSQKS